MKQYYTGDYKKSSNTAQSLAMTENERKEVRAAVNAPERHVGLPQVAALLPNATIVRTGLYEIKEGK